MNIESIKAAREAFPKTGDELLDWFEKYDQTILSCLSACEKIAAVDGDDLENGLGPMGRNNMKPVYDAARLVADIKKGQ